MSLPPRDVKVEVLERLVMVVGDVEGAVDHRRHPLLPQQAEVLRRAAVADVDAAPLRRRVDQIQRLVLLHVTLQVEVLYIAESSNEEVRKEELLDGAAVLATG